MLVRTVINNEDSSSRTWCFCRGFSAYKSDQKAIEQDIKSALLEFKNDCFWALESGIDWRTRLGSKDQKDSLDSDVINVIENRYGVISVQDFESIVLDRAYTSKCNVYTIFSEEGILLEFSQSI